MKRVVQFTVHGEHATAGSKTAVRYTDKAGNSRTLVKPADPRQRLFQTQISEAAAKAARGKIWRDEALLLEVTIVRQRPKSHYSTSLKRAGVLKESAPARPVMKPDSLKIVRAIEDAMNGVVYRDDSQICSHLVEKVYGETSKTIITVSEVSKQWELHR